MADIFISHSGKDNEVAAAIGERIRRERPTWSLFYDKDNIRAGQRWQERLREELQSCRMVVALLSRNWLASPWCFTEAVTATFRGKDVVAIETEDLTSDDLARAPPIVHERQRVRLRDGDDRPGRRSWRLSIVRGSTPTTGSRSRRMSAPIPASSPSTRRMPACSSAASRRSPSIWASSTPCAGRTARRCWSSPALRAAANPRCCAPA